MKIGEKIRKIWHDFFYRYASAKGVDFALRCSDVTAIIDLREKPNRPVDHLRFHLHLNLCQACNNYHKMSGAIHRAIVRSVPQKLAMEELNGKLVEKFGRKPAGNKGETKG